MGDLEGMINRLCDNVIVLDKEKYEPKPLILDKRCCQKPFPEFHRPTVCANCGTEDREIASYPPEYFIVNPIYGNKTPWQAKENIRIQESIDRGLNNE